MKKFYLLITAVFCIFEVFPQATFNTGALQVDVNVYGRIRLFTADDIRHLQRASILAGTSASAVFDYQNDAEELETMELVEDPQLSDFEIYGAFDNSWSGDPPDLVVRLNAYGWTNGGYVIFKFNVESAESSAMDFKIGLDIIPELNQEYGYDTVTYLTGEGVIRFHRGDAVNMGLKLLSHPLTSLFSFEWYDGYTEDGDYWTWLNYGMLQPQYVSNTIDGPVTITSQDAVSLANGESVDIYYAMALGADEEAMLSSISMAQEKYDAWFTGVDEPLIAKEGLGFGQPQPSPFTLSTTISYSLPEAGQTSLAIYNTLGELVASLVNEVQPAGQHMVEWTAAGLPEGLYFCSLKLNGQQQTIKIIKGR